MAWSDVSATWWISHHHPLMREKNLNVDYSASERCENPTFEGDYKNPAVLYSSLPKMVRFVSSSMILLAATRLSAAFVPSVRSFGRVASSVAASDNDFDDFSSKIAFMFPGQGAQFVGMCGGTLR